jgi:2-oxoglutarate ferredoxin oxidoreductase subunit alpha
VFILTDQALATRIEAFDEPDLANLMVKPVLDLSERPADFKPFPLDRMTRLAPPGTRMAGGKYPTVSGLEHDELGHPSGSPVMHRKMTAKRREKIKALGAELAVPEVFGAEEGDVLIIGWGCTWGPIREAVVRLQADGVRAGQMHLRHLHPLPNGLEKIFGRYQQVVVAEMNDQGLYGFGQLAMLLRARYALPSIKSVTKTDGLTFKIREIVDGVNAHLGRNAQGPESEIHVETVGGGEG